MPSFWKKDDPNKGRVLLARFGNNTRWVDKDALRLWCAFPSTPPPLDWRRQHHHTWGCAHDRHCLGPADSHRFSLLIKPTLGNHAGQARASEAIGIPAFSHSISRRTSTHLLPS